MYSEKHLPKKYVKPRPTTAELVNRHFHEWDKKRIEMQKNKSKFRMPPTVCLSRRIGVGVQEVAEILAERIGYRVIDREILDHIPQQDQLSNKMIAFFNELYPNVISEYLSLLTGQKGFETSLAIQTLFGAIYSLASLEPTIFVGRGAYLVLPRDRVLAVRFIRSKKYRLEHIAETYNLSQKVAKNKLLLIDKQQKDFFKNVYGKKNIMPYEFDLIVNCDFITDPRCAAEIVATALKEKFGAEFSQ